jgi:tetratricopeptide (TPR) repeat protein
MEELVKSGIGVDGLEYYARGVSYALAGDHGRAIMYYEKSLSLSADYSLSYYGLSQSYVELENYVRALSSFKKYVDLVCGNVELSAGVCLELEENSRSVDIFIECGDMSGALVSCRRAIELDTVNALLYFKLGALYMLTGDLGRAPYYLGCALILDWSTCDELIFSGESIWGDDAELWSPLLVACYRYLFTIADLDIDLVYNNIAYKRSSVSSLSCCAQLLCIASGSPSVLHLLSDLRDRLSRTYNNRAKASFPCPLPSEGGKDRRTADIAKWYAPPRHTGLDPVSSAKRDCITAVSASGISIGYGYAIRRHPRA